MITDTQILDALEPHFKEIRKWHDLAVNCVNEISAIMGEKSYRMFKRNKSGIINNCVLEEASKYFENIKGVKVCKQFETIVLKFDSGFTGRFRKQATHIKESCKCTTRNNNYIQGTLFEEYQPSVSLEINYETNEVCSEIKRLSIVKRVDRIPFELKQIPAEFIEQPSTFKAMEVVLPDEDQDNQLTIKKSS